MPEIKALRLPRTTDVVVIGAAQDYRLSRDQFAAWRQLNPGATAGDADVFIKAAFSGLKGCDVYVHVFSLPVSVAEAPCVAVLVADEGSPVEPDWWEDPAE